ncbi:hypothetical protein THAOC_07465 [Thalassiosira oceanica]|uniref:Uncharacterized protein n=1 Tax=Thalassiosira oceanica TaxID=159749 RepID=K0T1S7_THAOC|nr:hypothetical protein THAOC_07465 [Thalassiosira oceanica]|mmetsp:Transcript_20867/g.49033  ORF Transcript_20867/g.49033 Transcript_20867/m.49033 type:complete len:191 (+) Transcript_20867:128-700(+)|eukprot:EJK71124.1 hypothetical protein THAOC_07465 [Thalassiosira oceanica]
MGWQSYVLPYRDSGHKRRILESIKEHNDNTGNSGVGEKLFSVVDVPIDAGPHSGCIICGHGGGRSQTFAWFDVEHDVDAFPYGDQGFELPSNKEWMEINDGWEKVKEDASVLEGISTAFGRAVVDAKNPSNSGADGTSVFDAEALSLVMTVSEVFRTWAAHRAQVLKVKAKTSIESMMRGTPFGLDDDSD